MTIRHGLVTASCRKGWTLYQAPIFQRMTQPCRVLFQEDAEDPTNAGSLRSNHNIYVAFRGGDMINREQGYFYCQSWLLSGTPYSLGLDSPFLPLPFNLTKSTIIDPIPDTVGNVKMKKFDPKGKSERIKHNRNPEIKICIKLSR